MKVGNLSKIIELIFKICWRLKLNLITFSMQSLRLRKLIKFEELMLFVDSFLLSLISLDWISESLIGSLTFSSDSKRKVVAAGVATSFSVSN